MKQIIKDVAEQFDTSQKLAGQLVKAVIEGITKELLAKESIRVTDLGTISLQLKKARNARNPKTGEAVLVPEKKVIKFKPATSLKEKVQ